MYVNTYKHNQKLWNGVLRHRKLTDQWLFKLHLTKVDQHTVGKYLINGSIKHPKDN